MVQSKGILQRAGSLALCGLLLGTLTGCDIADRLRPDLNFNSQVRVFPEEEGVVDGDVQPGPNIGVWPAGSPNTGEFSYTNPDRSVYAENFVGTPADMIGATEYSTYLREQVYQPLLEIIEGLDSDVQAKLYLRCVHVGYDLINGKLTRRSGWPDCFSGRSINYARMVGGSTFITFVEDWVGGLDKNASNQDLQIKKTQDTINAYITGEDMQKSWFELANANIPVDIYRMFGRESEDFKTMQEYYDAVSSDPYRNIPGYSFYYYTGDTTTDRIIFNKVATDVATPYQPGVEISMIEKMCTSYNQYITRDRASVDNTTMDDDSILHYYLDGYNKTIMFIGTMAGENLKTLVGEDTYREMYNIIHGAYTCIECNDILAIKPSAPPPSESVDPSASPDPSATPAPVEPDYSGFTVIPAGTKGVD